MTNTDKEDEQINPNSLMCSHYIYNFVVRSLLICTLMEFVVFINLFIWKLEQNYYNVKIEKLTIYLPQFISFSNFIDN